MAEQPKANSYFEAVWVAGGVYHVYNTAVHRNVLFEEPGDYWRFVALLLERITPFAEIFAYGLIPNHFHFAIRLLPAADLRAHILAKTPGKRYAHERKWLVGECPYHRLIGTYWATFYAMYAAYFNPRAGRKGTLFDQTVRRIRVRADLISRTLIMYIHTNEVKHRLLSDYRHSGARTSYAYYGLEREDHWLARESVLARFGGAAAFYRDHERYVRKYGQAISAFDEAMYFEPPGGSTLAEAPYLPFLEDTGSYL